MFRDFAGLLRNVFTGLIEFALQSGDFGFGFGQAGLQGLRSCLLRGQLQGLAFEVGFRGSFEGDDLDITFREEVGVMATFGAEFVFAGCRYAVDFFLQFTDRGVGAGSGCLFGGGLDGRRPDLLEPQAQGFRLGAGGAGLTVARVLGEEFGSDGRVLIFRARGPR